MKINVTEYLGETALRCGNCIAIEDVSGKINFNQLQTNAFKIADTLLGLNPLNSPIPLFLAKSKESITAFVGINYSDFFMCDYT
jgi:hypothetical protein